MRAFALLLGFVACTYSEARFDTEYADAMCAWSVDCFDIYADVDTCLQADPSDIQPSGDYFDADAARDCVGGLRVLTCPADNEIPAYPDACACVYDACNVGE